MYHSLFDYQWWCGCERVWESIQESGGIVCLPKEIRNTLHIDVTTPLEISTNGETISINKYKPDSLEEKVREMQSILTQQVENIGLEKVIKIESELNIIQELLQ